MATEAEVSSRHLCFIETGRASPSREMLLRLARVLDVPLRERNSLLLAAGFAPMYRETNIDAAELGPVRSALDAILRQQEPFPALVFNFRVSGPRRTGPPSTCCALLELTARREATARSIAKRLGISTSAAQELGLAGTCCSEQ